MAGGEAGSKLVRLFAFAGAGFVCTAAINTWRDLQRKSVQQKAQSLEKQSDMEEDIEVLLRALAMDADDDIKLRLVADNNIKHFQEYNETRRSLLQDDILSFFSPTWCTPLENSFLWIAGCRPTIFIRLLYSLYAFEFDQHLAQYLKGVRTGNLADLSAPQLNMVNDLHCQTVQEQLKLSNRMASLQEDIADEQTFLVGNSEPRPVGESSRRADQAFNSHILGLACLLEEADKLRLHTLKVLASILTPLQAVDLLVAVMRLRLSIHEWVSLQHGT